MTGPICQGLDRRQEPDRSRAGTITRRKIRPCRAASQSGRGAESCLIGLFLRGTSQRPVRRFLPANLVLCHTRRSRRGDVCHPMGTSGAQIGITRRHQRGPVSRTPDAGTCVLSPHQAPIPLRRDVSRCLHRRDNAIVASNADLWMYCGAIFRPALCPKDFRVIIAKCNQYIM